MKKKTLALVGLGNISPKLSPVIKNNNYCELIVVCDINEKSIGRQYYKNIPFHKDYHDLLEYYPDYVYVATDPASHYEIASFFLAQGISVLCEKPPTVSFDEFKALNALAERMGVGYHVIYHFRYSNEILWLKDHMQTFGELRFASARYDDPYCDGSHIIEGRQYLMGAWMDSASNILSAWSYLFPRLSPENLAYTIERDEKFHLPIRVVASFEWNRIPFSIRISWKNNTRNKELIFVFEKGVVYIDLPNQEIYFNGERKLSNNYSQSTMAHYNNFFNDMAGFLKDKQNDAVTKVLYSVQ